MVVTLINACTAASRTYRISGHRTSEQLLHAAGVSARDPRVYAGVALLILVVTLLASALPTLRAARSSPLDALRIPQ